MNDITYNVRQILKAIEGPTLRKDLERTPIRVQKSYEEMIDGYNVNIESLFTTSDGEGMDQIVAMRNITGWSLCEHHLLPFSFIAHVAYLPRDRVIGASKLERLVIAYAHRLQLQERITRQVADALMNYLNPRGVAVIIIGEHLCTRCRGVKSPSSELVSSIMLGSFREEQSARIEVLSLLGLK